MIVVGGLIVTYLVQGLFGIPGSPAWLVDLMLPVPWLLAPVLLGRRVSVFGLGLALGLAWDLVTGSIVGPGAIAWSAAGLAVDRSSQVIADRSVLAWGAFGMVCAALAIMLRQVALLPLGEDGGWGWYRLARSVVLTGVLSAAVGWMIQLDLIARWKLYQRRKLR